MRIIVSDTSCLIDLQRGDLLEVFLELPFEFVIPDVLVDEELLSFTRKETALLRRRMTVAGLEPRGIDRVTEILAASPALSNLDGFALVIAEQRPGSILLTGDRRLRSLAEAQDIEVHGVLWVIKQLLHHRVADRRTCLVALETWRDDPATRLPRHQLGRLIAELKRRR